MPLKLNQSVLAAARQLVDRSRKRLQHTGVMLDPRLPVVVRGVTALHCNHHSHSDQDKYNFEHAPEWKALREQVLGARGPRCQNCGSKSRLAVHHRYYFPGHEIWEYEEADLLILCKACHSIVHNRVATADRVTYYELCWERLREVERAITNEENAWEIEHALGYHTDPTLLYDEDNSGYWEEEFNYDLGDLAEERALAQLEECYDPVEDD